MQQATHPRLHLRDTRDAHIIFEAVRQGFLKPVTRRLNEAERSMSVRSGAVFVWEERDDESGLKRWTDGRLWGQSRMREPYLFYDEKLPSTPGSEPSTSPRSPPAFRFVDGVSRTIPSSSALLHQDRSGGNHPGLIKQAYSAWVQLSPTGTPRKWHLTAYFTYADLPTIPTVDADAILRNIIVPPGIYQSGKARKGDDGTTETFGHSALPPLHSAVGVYNMGVISGSSQRGHHLCGILGLLLHDSNTDAAPEVCEGLSLLQHRGQDACGIVACGPKGRFYQCKANGMVRDIFDEKAIQRLVGGMAVGHVRYPTAGSFNNAEAQPFYVNSPYGIVFAHNGNLINTASLLQFLDATAHRHINTSSDSELLLNIFANNLQQTGKFRINEEDIFTAIGGLMKQCKGAYACVAMLAGFGIIAFRDPNGIRPVGMAVRKSATTQGKDYLFASESVVADASGFSEWEDVKPGEAVIITRESVSRRQVAAPAEFAPDIFEYVYFARPDSVLDGISVYRSRMAMGDALADEVRRVLAEQNLSVDVVIPVPDTSRVAALNLAQKLQLPYREGFIKNRYVGRTFIMPGQQMRKKNVRRKLNAMALEFSGKNILLVDDSIVRGTTSKEIIQMAKDVGAKKVVMASCAPPIRYPNVYGIDMPSRTELVAYGRDTNSIASAIGADLVIFQTLPDLISSVRQFNPHISAFDCSVFTGEYVTGGVDEPYLAALEGQRADNVRGKAKLNGINGSRREDVTVMSSGPMNGADDTVGLHNTWQSN